ncbi:PAS domain-containing protein [Ideonella sp. B7]|uniref:sensor histidine kinase n=1 Tax=Ideonella benzenivorans TaxID=2831643 RepID=UPI001CED99CC|nr:ATP-binding protein [Ideonella benzenivorans]MCA6218865.1 PAS domain-containing protein [Ideonella benzenivorans]
MSGDADTGQDSSWFGPTAAFADDLDTTDDSTVWTARVRRLLHGGRATQRRIYATYLLARAALGLVLLAAQGLLSWLGARSTGWVFWLGVGYALQACVRWGWWKRRAAQAQRLTAVHWWGTVGVDVLVFGLMHWLDATSALNYGALLVLPVLMAGVLSTRLPALATASAVTLLLLLTALHKGLEGGDLAGMLSQAGLAGAGVFMIALVAGQMTQRLAREERAARDSLELAFQQAELNRLVIDEMSDGVLVVDRTGRVRAANPAARALLSDQGQCPLPPFPLGQEKGWRPLRDAVQAAYEAGHWPLEGIDLSVAAAGEVPRSIRVRARFTRGVRLTPSEASAGRQQEVLAVLFAEELRQVLARQRQERLVAMGRISAGVAHEIRNPLAAVAQANALLQEDALRPDQQRLVRIMADNVERLRRIVDDVLEAAPGGSTPSRCLDAVAETGTIVSEWAHTVGLPLGGTSRLQVLLPSAPLGVSFDSDHLRRVLVNLLDNALRHASDQPGAVCLQLEPLEGEFVRLTVANDGLPIPAEVEPHLFEPFHSTRSRGTGLGLYICRELCERHGALIDYVRRPDAARCNQFVVVMRRDAVPDEARLHL